MTDFGTPGSFPTPPTPPIDSRSGPPWEQPGAFFQRWIDTAKTILLDPQGGFRNVRRTGGLGAPLTYYLIGAGVYWLSIVFWNLIGFGMSLPGMGDAGGGAMMAGGLVGIMVGMIVMIIVGFFIGTGIIHLVLSLLGGSKHGYEATARTFAYAYGSALPIAIVPFCGGFIAGIWGLVCAIMGLANMQDTTPVKSAIAIFTPLVLCCLAMVLFWAAIMAMLVGGASMQ